jgi:hypothetical protein
MKIFISYSGNGKALAGKLCNRMIQSGIDAWTYDNPNYMIGDITWFEIYEHIQKSEWMIVLLTSSAPTSVNQTNEYMHALMLGVKTFAFSEYKAKIPEQLKSRNMGIFRRNGYENACTQLISNLKEHEKRIEKELSSERGILQYQKLIPLIRRKIEGLNVQKAQECRNIIIENYLKKTIIRRVTKIGFVFDENESDLQGQYFLFETDIEHFNRPDWDYRVICSQAAEAIVAGEHRELRERLLRNQNNISTLPLSKSGRLDLSMLQDKIDLLYRLGHTPDVILAPIVAFQDFVKFFEKNIDWPVGEREKLKLKEKQPLTIYWSSNIVPLQEFIIFDSTAIRWRIKPDEVDGALATAIGVSPLYKDKVSFFAGTLFKIELLNQNAIQVIKMTKETSADIIKRNKIALTKEVDQQVKSDIQNEPHQNKTKRMSVIQSHVALAIGLMSTSLFGSGLPGLKWGQIVLYILAAIFVINSLIVGLFYRVVPKKVLANILSLRVQNLRLFLALVTLGLGFWKVNAWMIPGALCVYSAYGLLSYNISSDIGSIIRGRKNSRSSQKA